MTATARTATAMESALTRAGMNTAPIRLRQMAHDALKKHHGNCEKAGTTFIAAVGNERELIRAALQAYVAGLFAELGPQAFMRVDHGGDERQSPSVGASNGTGHIPSGARPVAAGPARNSSSPGRLAAASRVAGVIRVTILDTYRIRGRVIGDIRVGEIRRLKEAALSDARTNLAEVRIFEEIEKIGVADHNMQIRDVVKVAELQRIIQRAAEFADAAR